MNYNLRGKCKEMSEELARKDPTLTLIAGFYYEPYWNREEEHWWCERPDGTIVDPTSSQFPSGGIKEFYRKFKGVFNCSECGDERSADSMIHEGRFHFCNDRCYMRCVGLL